MPAPNASYSVQEIPLKIVGGVHYGRYPKISAENTWNCIVSDDALVPYAGYKNVLDLTPSDEGRGIYTSFRGGFMIAVIGFTVWRINYTNSGVFYSQFVGNLQTNTGDVYISENNNGEIAITDTAYIYVYNWANPSTPALVSNVPASSGAFSFPFQSPGYISFQNGRLIVACEGTTNWVLSGFNAATSWTTNASSVGSLQSKPDLIQAVVPVPGGSQNIIVFGRNVAELWQDVGNSLFPYQRNSTFSSDFGCINPSTIASLKNFIVWIAVNEQSGPVLMISTGNTVESISTDGIDYKIGNLTQPENCTGFLFQQDGHLIYQFTFPADNVSYAYDFETKLFFSVSDENLNYHIARQVVYFGPSNSYYFVSLNGGNIYEFNSAYPEAIYSTDTSIVKLIPRIRITAPFRLPTQRMFIIKSAGFTIENGQPNIVQNLTHTSDTNDDNLATESGLLILTESREIISTEEDTAQVVDAYYTTSQSQVYLAVSRDGGQTFGSFYPLNMNSTGQFKSRLIWQRLGQANDAVFQFRFVGITRFVAFDGIIEVYQ